MMDRREALLLAERLKRRTRDPDVLTLGIALCQLHLLISLSDGDAKPPRESA